MSRYRREGEGERREGQGERREGEGERRETHSIVKALDGRF